MIHRPSWFADDKVMVSTAPTCGLTKGGRLLPKIDPKTGSKIQETDPDTGESIDAINDQLLADMVALREGKTSDTLRHIDRAEVSLRHAVPVYYDRRYDVAFQEEMKSEAFKDFRAATIGELIQSRVLSVRAGHGSPSADQRVGDVPYIKVSDLRAGLVNINPTNRVPHRIAERFWGGSSSGLQPFDLLSPERTSKNIGDFCLLMPGQERVLLTKEIIVMRPGEAANFDTFYLLWAMTLKVVRDQWKRIVFMQTNREDVGKRYLEISIPIPLDKEAGREASKAFRDYYTTLSVARAGFAEYLSATKTHHFFVSGAEPPDPEDLAMAMDATNEDDITENTPNDEGDED